MKRYFLLLFIFFATTGNIRAQNVSIGLHSGVALYAGNGNSIGIPAGLNAEWAYNAVHSFSGRAHYNIGVGNGGINFFYISPEYKYHLTGEALSGFYLGGYIGFGGGGGSGYFSLGGITGYSYHLGKNLNLETNIQLGWGNFTNLRVNVLHFVPTVGLRYGF